MLNNTMESVALPIAGRRERRREHRRVTFHNLDLDKEQRKSAQGPLNRKLRKQCKILLRLNLRYLLTMQSGSESELRTAKLNNFENCKDALENTFNVISDDSNKEILKDMHELTHDVNAWSVFEAQHPGQNYEDVVKLVTYLVPLLKEVARADKITSSPLKHLYKIPFDHVWSLGNKVREYLYLMSKTKSFSKCFYQTDNLFIERTGADIVHTNSSSSDGSREKYQVEIDRNLLNQLKRPSSSAGSSSKRQRHLNDDDSICIVGRLPKNGKKILWRGVSEFDVMEELKAQQENLKTQQEELKAQREELKAQQEELRTQQEELRTQQLQSEIDKIVRTPKLFPLMIARKLKDVNEAGIGSMPYDIKMSYVYHALRILPKL